MRAKTRFQDLMSDNSEHAPSTRTALIKGLNASQSAEQQGTGVVDPILAYTVLANTAKLIP